MTELLSIAASLTATPLADPLATPTAPTTDEADPFAEMLAAVLVAPVAPKIAITPDAPIVAAPAAPVSLAPDDVDAPAPDAPASDDGTLDDSLAASVSAMLAIALPPTPVVVPVVAPVTVPVAPDPAATTTDVPVAAVSATNVPAPKAKVPAPTTEVAVPTSDAQPAAQPVAVASQSDSAPVIVPSTPAQTDAPTTDSDRPAKAAAPSSDVSAESSDAPVASTTSTPVRAATAPRLPAAILRMLREAPIAPVAAVQPQVAVASTVEPDPAVATQTAASVPTGTPATRTAGDSSRRDTRVTATRSTTPAGRPVAAKAPRTAEAVKQAPADPIALPFTDPRTPAPAAPANVGQEAAPVDSLVQNQLAIGRDDKWLDSLARDIASSASGNNLHFKLAPENLGSLTVSIAAMADGAAIRMTADTDRAHQILTDAQPKLIAEARAQGLRVSESHVELNNGSNSGGGSASAWGQAGGQSQPNAQQQSERRQQTSSPNHLPLASKNGDEATDETKQGSSERYA